MRGFVGLLLVGVLALALAVGLTSHHDEVAASAPVVAVEAADAAAAVPAPSEESLVACSLLVLCTVALLVIALRARRGSVEHPLAEPRLDPTPRELFLRIPPPPVSLDALSISRT